MCRSETGIAIAERRFSIDAVFLLDTNVVSELRRQRPHGAVLKWIDKTPGDQLFLSAVTIGEIQAGVELTREQDADKATEIEAWLDAVVSTYGVLPMDAAAFREWARIKHRTSDTLIEDAMIAATARLHRLTVATRNTRDFSDFPVDVFDPFTFGG